MLYLESFVSCLDFKAFIMCPARTLNFSPGLWAKERLDLAARDKPQDDQSHSKWWMPWLSSHRRCEIMWLLLWLCVQTKCIYLPKSYVLLFVLLPALLQGSDYSINPIHNCLCVSGLSHTWIELLQTISAMTVGSDTSCNECVNEFLLIPQDRNPVISNAQLSFNICKCLTWFNKSTSHHQQMLQCYADDSICCLWFWPVHFSLT